MPAKHFAFRRCRAGQIAIPFLLITSGFVLLLSNFGEIAPLRVQDLWPLLLISIGLENLVLRKWTSQ